MNTKVVIGIIAAIVVIGGGAWYLSTKPAGEAVETGENTRAQGTFADLMTRSGSWECDVTATTPDSTSAGTVFIADGQVRGDFTATVSGRSVTAHMIHADGYAYTWSDEFPQGMKVKVEAAAGTSGGQGIDPSTDVNYSCKPWMKSETAFAVPSTVTFFEVGAEGAGSIPAIPTPN